MRCHPERIDLLLDLDHACNSALLNTLDRFPLLLTGLDFIANILVANVLHDLADTHCAKHLLLEPIQALVRRVFRVRLFNWTLCISDRKLLNLLSHQPIERFVRRIRLLCRLGLLHECDRVFRETLIDLRDLVVHDVVNQLRRCRVAVSMFQQIHLLPSLVRLVAQLLRLLNNLLEGVVVTTATAVTDCNWRL